MITEVTLAVQYKIRGAEVHQVHLNCKKKSMCHYG